MSDAVQEVLDIREDLKMPAHSYLYYQIREIKPGQIFQVISDEEPTLLMQTVSLNLRHQIAWEVNQVSDNEWHVTVKIRDNAPFEDVLDFLKRDHYRLDKLFAKALHAANAGDDKTAAENMKLFGEGLRRHLSLEGDVLIPYFNDKAPNAVEPSRQTLQEHNSIIEQVVMIESFFEDEEEGGSIGAAPFMAMLSGYLAKHETREELNLFPIWKKVLVHDENADNILKQAQEALASEAQ